MIKNLKSLRTLTKNTSTVMEQVILKSEKVNKKIKTLKIVRKLTTKKV